MFVEFEPYALKDARAVLRRGKDASLYLFQSGSYYPRAHIDGSARHLDVDSSYPGAEEGPKGSAVRR